MRLTTVRLVAEYRLTAHCNTGKIVMTIYGLIRTVFVTGAFAGAVVPATAANFLLRAYDSNGVDSGTCIERVTGGYALKTCDTSASAQIFAFDNSGSPSTVAQGTECMTVPARLGNPFLPGYRTAGRVCGSSNYASDDWKLEGVQMIALDGATEATCLTADTNIPPHVELGDCAATDLAQWHTIPP